MTKEQIIKAIRDFETALLEDMDIQALYEKTAVKAKASHYKLQKAKQFMEGVIKDNK